MTIIFPPIVDTYIPIFVENCEIPFIMPSLNDKKSLAEKVIVSIVEQNTNKQIKDNLNVFFLADYKDNTIFINFEDKKNMILSPKKYYKVQLKFFNKEILEKLIEIEDKGKQEKSKEFLNEGVLKTYENYISEWSTICLIKKLSSEPKLELDMFTQLSSSFATFSSFDGVFSGRAIFGDADDENLKQIKLSILDKNKKILEIQEIYTAGNRNPNEFSFTPKYYLEEGELYYINLVGISENDYTFNKEYSFILKTSIKNLVLPTDTVIIAKNEEDYGRNKITISSRNSFKGNFVIKRSSSKENFNYWEDVHYGNFPIKKILNYIWLDYTIEDGTIYKYCVQGLLKSENKILRSPAIITEDSILSTFKSTFLVTENKQLNIKYNTQISSFSTVTKETKVETLGSKYPFIRKNGYLGYKEFSLSGLITLHMDKEESPLKVFKDSVKDQLEENLKENPFYSIDEIYDFSNNDEIKQIEKDKIKEYQEKNNLNEYNNVLYERLFREKVISFLQNNKVKLFKSPTEGNILIKLTNISLSPAETVLGRYLYNFSCTATEIDNFSIKNCDLYDIQSIGAYKEDAQEIIEKTIFGQYSGSYSGDLIAYLKEKYKYSTEEEERVNSLQYLNYLKIEFESDPIKVLYNQMYLMGYQVQINGNTIFVDSNGVFELSGNDVQIINLSIPKGQTALITYQAVVSEKDNIQKETTSRQFITSIGQIKSTFDKEQEYFKKLLNGKYYFKNESSYQVLTSINEISIEAEPGTIFEIADSEDFSNNQNYNYNTHIIGKTGILNLYNLNKDSTSPLILDLYSNGMHFYKVPIEDKLRAALDNSYFEYNEIEGNKNKSFSTQDEIAKPQEHCVYLINAERQLYYNGKFYLLDQNDNINIKNESIITYIYTKEVGYY